MYLSAIFLLAGALALTFAPAAHANPLDAWQGSWSGTCSISTPGQAPYAIRTTLNIRRLAGAPARYTWQIVYQAPGRPAQPRNYEIVARDPARGHYVIDEKNGLKLDAHLVANNLFSPLVIGRTMIATKYTKLKQGILMELPSFRLDGATTTCATANPAQCVRTFRLKSFQICFLRGTGQQ